jgi:hypothetical protein
MMTMHDIAEIGVFVLAVLGLWGRLERRLTILETKMDMLLKQHRR